MVQYHLRGDLMQNATNAIYVIFPGEKLVFSRILEFVVSNPEICPFSHKSEPPDGEKYQFDQE